MNDKKTQSQLDKEAADKQAENDNANADPNKAGYAGKPVPGSNQAPAGKGLGTTPAPTEGTDTNSHSSGGPSGKSGR